MRSKGFTLIELLAVIVILAIIALIATPIILGIIEDAGDEAIERSVENYLKAVNIAVAKENMEREFNPNECTVQNNGDLLCDGQLLKVEVDGNAPSSGTITFKNGNVDSYSNLYIDGKYANEGANGVIISKESVSACEIVSGDLTTVGSYVKCGEEGFYIIPQDTTAHKSASDDTVTLLTEDIIQDNVAFAYNDVVVSESESSGQIMGPYYATSAYSGMSFVYDENSLVYPYVNSYKQELESNGVAVLEASLMSSTQVNDITNNYCNESCGYIVAPSANESYGYWLGSVQDSSITIFSPTSGLTTSNHYEAGPGVRPVIVVNKDQF